MRTIFVITLMAAAALAQQTEQRILHFNNAATPQALQECVNTIRSVGDIQRAAADMDAKTIAISGTPEQIALADWLTRQLDQPTQGSHEYRAGGSIDDVVHVTMLANTPTPQGMQELVNAVRSVSELQRVIIYFQGKLVAFRGRLDQATLAESLIAALDQPAAPAAKKAGLKLQYADARAPEVRVYYMEHATSPQAVQEILNTIRSIADIQRLVSCRFPNALVMRGPAENIALAEWLLTNLDTASGAQNPSPMDFRIAATGEIARLYYVPRASSPQQLQALVNQVRTVSELQRVVPILERRSVTVRGTPAQLVAADMVLQPK